METYNSFNEMPEHRKVQCPGYLSHPVNFMDVDKELTIVYSIAHSYGQRYAAIAVLAPRIETYWDTSLMGNASECALKIRRATLKSDNIESFHKWVNTTARRLRGEIKTNATFQKIEKIVRDRYKQMAKQQSRLAAAMFDVMLEPPAIKVQPVSGYTDLKLRLYGRIDIIIKEGVIKYIDMFYSQPVDSENLNYSPTLSLLSEMAEDFNISHVSCDRYVYDGKGTVNVELLVNKHIIHTGDIINQLKRYHFVRRIMVQFMEELHA